MCITGEAEIFSRDVLENRAVAQRIMNEIGIAAITITIAPAPISLILYLSLPNVSVHAEARFGADSMERLVGGHI